MQCWLLVPGSGQGVPGPESPQPPASLMVGIISHWSGKPGQLVGPTCPGCPRGTVAGPGPALPTRPRCSATPAQGGSVYTPVSGRWGWDSESCSQQQLEAPDRGCHPPSDSRSPSWEQGFYQACKLLPASPRRRGDRRHQDRRRGHLSTSQPRKKEKQGRKNPPGQQGSFLGDGLLGSAQHDEGLGVTGKGRAAPGTVRKPNPSAAGRVSMHPLPSASPWCTRARLAGASSAHSSEACGTVHQGSGRWVRHTARCPGDALCWEHQPLFTEEGSPRGIRPCPPRGLASSVPRSSLPTHVIGPVQLSSGTWLYQVGLTSR